MLVECSASSPPTAEANFEKRVNGPDGGMVSAWLAGRELSSQRPDLAAAATANELPILAFAGGVERKIKLQEKLGALQYVAMWQGLRGDDLRVNLSEESVLMCSKHGVRVRFTADWRKLASAEDTP
ncbi:hypothetical protein [Ottowia sp. VDI28]|uniref:hypothetical protein n=1 Tax=Ottowia sp. VDI28 TaxID=3133968 RepID=UPI003C2EC5DF